MINPMKLIQLRPLVTKFQNDHPKFFQFIAAVGQSGMREGTIVEISITDPDGKNLCSNLKLSKEDLELFEAVSEMMKEQ